MSTPTGRLLDLVRELDGLKPPTLVALGQAVRRACLGAADVAEFVRPNPRGYNRVPVAVRDDYELLVMTWLPGQASVPHDHSGSICAMQVIRGLAVETSYRLAPDGYADPQYESPVPPAEVVAAQDAGIHSIRNASATGELLVTIHIYWPPLRDVRQFRTRPAAAPVAARARASDPPTAVVVGGGFSGATVAAQTLRRATASGAPCRVVVVERRGAVGEGVAYGTPDPAHLLNVPAGRMSAWPDRPNDFVDWAASRRPGVGPSDFLPRAWYGEYVRESLLAAAGRAGGASALTTLFDEVRRVSRHPRGGWMVHLARQPSVYADAVVLAVGHRPPPDPIGGRWRGPRTRLIPDPWRSFATNVVGPDDAVLVLGSGLTAVDVVLSLADRPRCAPLTLVSRHGLLPRAHAASAASPFDANRMVADLVAAPGGLRARVLAKCVHRAARALAAAGGDWRSVVDALRPHTPALWRAMPPAERRHFLGRIRPFWEVHRHRMAPTLAGALAALRSGGAVKVVAGSVAAVDAAGDGVVARIRPRGGGRVSTVEARWVINCTGPLPSNSVESNPAIGSLLMSGHVRPDDLGLGIETNAQGNPIAQTGNPVTDLFVVGTLRKPSDWESTAVPELRGQAAGVAEAVVHYLGRVSAGEDGGQVRAAA